MSIKITVFAILIVALTLTNTTKSLRDIPNDPEPKLDLAARLEATEGDTKDCWSALAEIRQCSNEIIGFFLNGKADIDTPCCNALEFITRMCWPSMLGVVGFTEQERNVLAGYCYSGSAPPPASAPLTVSRNSHF